jgi:hypothetical protein
MIQILVEGKLDAELLRPFLPPTLATLIAVGSKQMLRARSRAVRARGEAAYYLRDRDFDFEPLGDSGPIPEVGNLGWHWHRHEIENYLLEPAIVSKLPTVNRDQYETALLDAGERIRHYQAARWTIGQIRKALPPNYELQTRPDNIGELELPEDLGLAAIHDWAVVHVGRFRERVVPLLEPRALAQEVLRRAERLANESCLSIEGMLVWFSGKDIMAALSDWLTAHGLRGPGAFRSALRDWIINNPEEARELLPEWRRFSELIRAL